MVTVAYFVAEREVPYHEELRYSLRSIERFHGVDEVWLIGTKPGWVRGVRHVKVADVGGKVQSWSRKLEALVQSDIPERFLLVDCDMMALGPSDITLWGCDLWEKWQRVQEGRSPGDPERLTIEGAVKLLARLGVPKERWWTLENHWPQMLNKSILSKVLRSIPAEFPAFYYLAPYAATVGVELVDDCKIYDGPLLELPWVSLDDWSWKGEAGQEVRRRFQTSTRFES